MKEWKQTLLCFYRYDYLKIENDYGQFFGIYCGQRSGVNVVVTGHTAVITFHSDSSWQERGYQLVFSYFLPGKYYINLSS